MSFLAVVLCLLVTEGILSCGGGGGGGGTPPSALSYSDNALVATLNKKITPDIPTVTGKIASYGISPALPAGLALDSSTGILSGTPAALAAKALYTVTAANASGSTTASIQITVNPEPPSGLSYSQSSISAFLGQAIAPDTPTVTGTVTAYTVSPALPAGLSLDSFTGIISGSPTATSQSSCTVTASNDGGSTTTTITITVTTAPQPPTIVYPSPAITTWVGLEITPDIPATTGGLSVFTVSPGLPAGLSLNPATGIIIGTPAGEAAQAAYTVTGSSADGTATATTSLTIMVTPAPNILLQLGHQYRIDKLRFTGQSVLSLDISGFWNLWDYQSGAILARGQCLDADMAGPTLVLELPGGFQFRSSTDGHVLSTWPAPAGYWETSNSSSGTWRMASDGSYIAIGTSSGLFFYNPSGKLLFSGTGSYHNLSNSTFFFAAPDQLQIANGPKAPNSIETVAVPGGVSTVSPAYQGEFLTWFADGAKFLTMEITEGTVSGLLTYSSTGALLGTNPFPPGNASEGGVGNWVWTTSSSDNGPQGSSINIFPVNSFSPALTITRTDVTGVAPSGTSLAVLYNDNSFSIVDLSGSAPTQTDYTIPIINHADLTSRTLGPLGSSVSAFAAISSAQWVGGMTAATPGGEAFGSTGLILDGATLSSTSPRYLGVGAALSIAGSASNVAIATGSGQIFYFDPSNTTSQGSVALTSENVQLSSDGGVMAASAQDDSLLNIYALPSGSISNTFNYSAQSAPGLLTTYNLAGSGTILGQIENIASVGNSFEITSVSGSPTILAESPTKIHSVLLSPDGTLAALSVWNEFTQSSGPRSINLQYNLVMDVVIDQNGQQIGQVADFASVYPAMGYAAVGWIDSSRLLVNRYTYFNGTNNPPSPVYSGAAIVSPTGVLATPPLPELHSIQPVTSDTVYEPGQNVIYSLSTGQPVWTSPYPQDSGSPGTLSLGFADEDRVGAIAGPYVVYVSGGNVIAVKY